ncbi:MAG TPA: pyruvate:ferredoxin (flavodoxin) oxidoreductase [Deinococcales bacterium]|nr:pyruvate:ferredoxin (flavodoxin) oxidoreductase [Deinococcales bacterium]
MSTRPLVTYDGNDAAAFVAHKTNEVIAIYPITPSSGMGELADQFSAAGQKNIWGTVPLVQEMQSEGGAAGAVHGALQTGSLTTTFTASQGLLLMIPNMYKIAGELTSTVFHVAARSLAAQGLSIFGDHQDIMAARQTGWAILMSAGVQEVMDFALISQAATLEARVPFIHAFDGFRTSHEVQKVEKLLDDDIVAMMPMDRVREHRARGLSPERPMIRGTAQNPDVYFQGRETVNPFYNATPGIVQAQMDRFAKIVGRQYHLFDYVGAPDAERVVVVMGSAAETVEEAIEYLSARGEQVGLVKVRLFRPFSTEAMVQALPASVKAIAVLDRTKEPGAVGEPLYMDVVSALAEHAPEGRFAQFPRVIGGRYGLSSKEFTPAMALAVFAELAKPEPKRHFTVGINDDVTHLSLDFDPDFSLDPAGQVQAMFWGLGSDGTVGANKNSIKIIGEETDFHAQGYFVYDSKKSGARTVSHLRFGPKPIHSPYLIQRADFIAVHQFNFIERYDVLTPAKKGATLLLNSPYSADETWEHLPRPVQQAIQDKQIRLFVIDAYEVAANAGMGNRINTVMQTCFFAISGVLEREEAIKKIKKAIEKTYSKRGRAVVEKNFQAVDDTLAHLHQVNVPSSLGNLEFPPVVPGNAPDFVRDVLGKMISGEGDLLPVSALPVDGTYPSGTTQFEKRNLAQAIPVWETDLCIQCGKCVLVCPHAVIRAKAYDPAELEGAPETFKHMEAKFKELPGQAYTIQVAAEDCTGCALCVEFCPAKDKSNPSRKAINMQPQLPLVDAERTNWDFFLSLPEVDESLGLRFNTVKNVQLMRPLFEFSGACSGCGETPYLKLMSQLFGDRALIANATGCSSIYGGNLPTTPWTVNARGHGPAWSNSLFEDNAEFGLGMRLTLNKQGEYARELVTRLNGRLGDTLVSGLLEADQSTREGVESQRARVEELKHRLATDDSNEARDLLALADLMVDKSLWIVGGDGWAYDIGYGGLDHVLASGQNVNVLVLDTEVYSNTGGQASKSTPMAAVAKFAAAGKGGGKKSLARLAMEYQNVYVAQVAMGANDQHTVRAFLEAESYQGPSLIIAYSHCIAHGIDMQFGLNQQKLATLSGHWPLFRFDPRLRGQDKNPFQLDSRAPSIPLRDYVYNETRYKMLSQSNPERAAMLLADAQAEVERNFKRLELLAAESH